MGSILGNSVSNEIYFVYGLIAVVLVLIVIILMMDHKEKKRLHKNLFNNKVLKKNLKKLEQTGELPVVKPKKEEKKPIIPITRSEPIILDKASSTSPIILDPIDSVTEQINIIKESEVKEHKPKIKTDKPVEIKKVTPVKVKEEIKQEPVKVKEVEKKEIIKEKEITRPAPIKAEIKLPPVESKEVKPLTPRRIERAFITKSYKKSDLIPDDFIEQEIKTTKSVNLNKNAKEELLDAILDSTPVQVAQPKKNKIEQKAKAELLDEILEERAKSYIAKNTKKETVQLEEFTPHINKEKVEVVNKEDNHRKKMQELAEISQIEYIENEDPLEKTQAQIELAKITEELENNIDDDLISQTTFEKEQEESAIISIDELMKRSDELYDVNEKNQYLAEESLPITIEELKRKVELETNSSVKVSTNDFNKPVQNENAYRATTGSTAYVTDDDVEMI